MVETHGFTHRAPRAIPARVLQLGAVLIAVLFAFFVWGGYGMHWRWTGLSDSVTLWDWLQVLALPVALAAAPLLLQHRKRLTARHRTVLAGVVAAFALVVLLGYLVPMAWTGFTGNTLWDWLELVLLPLVVATASLWTGRVQLRRLHVVGVLVAALVFVGLIASGYLVPLTWTGFRGNTVWDWVKLLLVPVLLPTVVLPLVAERLNHRLAPPDLDTPGAA